MLFKIVGLSDDKWLQFKMGRNYNNKIVISKSEDRIAMKDLQWSTDEGNKYCMDFKSLRNDLHERLNHQQ